MGRLPLPRRLRAELLAIRDERAARLIERLCRQLEAAEGQFTLLKRDLFEMRQSIGRVCAAARLPARSIDSVEIGGRE